MPLTEREKEKLLVMIAADLARRRLKRGVRLNYAECVALITSEIREGAREGKSIAELAERGRRILRADQVMDEVPSMMRVVRVEAAFPDGPKLVLIHHPIAETAG